MKRFKICKHRKGPQTKLGKANVSKFQVGILSIYACAKASTGSKDLHENKNNNAINSEMLLYKAYKCKLIAVA